MNQADKQPSGFFDKNTLVAIVLSFAVFFFWQQYMNKKYPKKIKEGAEVVKLQESSTKQMSTNEEKVSKGLHTGQQDSPATEEKSLKYESEYLSFILSSQGMSLKELTLKKFKRRDRTSIIYGFPLDDKQINQKNNFELAQQDKNTFIGNLHFEGTHQKVIITVYPEKYLIRTTVQMQKADGQSLDFTTTIKDVVNEVKSSFLLPPTDFQEFFVEAQGKITREKMNPENNFDATYNLGQMMGINSQYFALTFLNTNELAPKVEAQVKDKLAQLRLSYLLETPRANEEVTYEFYVGPKKDDILEQVNSSLPNIIDYGIFGFIGRPMHTALVFAHKYVNNWGLAIILITILLRTLILPVGVYSFRAMKKMQKLQPKLQAIKEKYKNDPQKINQETLQLMRTEKANPLSGCIPALLQIPIFVAFFSMMSSSFELYMQPFYFWIQDLSYKDPFYVFPLLAGAGMFVQQKLTPMTTVDPAQAKIMAMMPLLFSVFMLSTPSGLALYMFVGSIFSIFQQLIFMKEKTT